MEGGKETKPTWTPEEIAVAASYAMILEAAAYPKPGNVHRLKDFKDTSFEHFLASAVSVQPVFQKSAASKTDPAFGPFFYESVLKSRDIQTGGNTHFGTLTLLLPLIAAAGRMPETAEKKGRPLGSALEEKAAEICRNTSFQDAVCFYKAFELLSIQVQTPEKGTPDFELDLTNPNAIEKISAEKISLYTLMAMGASRDMVALEWINGFEKSGRFAQILLQNKAWFEKHPKKCFGSAINSAVVFSFLEMMAAYPDTLIATKHGQKTAVKVQKKAERLVQRLRKNRNLKKEIKKIRKLDKKMRKKKMNPGSLADIAGAGIFIAWAEGLTV